MAELFPYIAAAGACPLNLYPNEFYNYTTMITHQIYLFKLSEMLKGTK